MTKQSSISSFTPNNVDSISTTQLQSVLSTFEFPTHSDPQFSLTTWNKIHHLAVNNPSQAYALRTSYDENSNEYALLSGFSYPYYDDIELSDVFTIVDNTTSETETRSETVHTFLHESVKRFPLTILLSTWITQINIDTDDTYLSEKDDVKSSSYGFYDPESHELSVRKDIGETETKYWPVNRSSSLHERYVRSTTLHEIGHAIHYMLSLQTENPDTVDNSKQTPQTITLQLKDIPRNSWQSEWILDVITSYGMGLSDHTDRLTFPTRRYLRTVEEFVAEGYCTYITSPKYLQQTLPILYNCFDRYTVKI